MISLHEIYMKNLFLIFGLTFSVYSFSESIITEDSAKDVADKFMSYMVNNEFQKGVDSIKPYTMLSNSGLDELVSGLDIKLPSVEKSIGISTGLEFLRSEKIGNSFVRYIYLQKFEKDIYAWEIRFYKNTAHWKISAVNFTNNYDFLFEKQTKIKH